MSHLRSCWGLPVVPDPPLDSYLCCILWGSTPSLTPVPSISLIWPCGEVNSGSGSSCRSLFGLQLFDLSLGSTPSSAPVTSMSHLRSSGGFNSGSGSSSRSIFGLQFFDLSLGSTPFLAVFPSMSYLRSCGGGQLCILIQLWIHICVVPFEDPLHHWLQAHLCLTLAHEERSTLDLDPAPNPCLGCNIWP